MNRPGTGRAALARPLAAHSNANAHVGLVTRAPGDTFTLQWEAEWWNSPHAPSAPTTPKTTYRRTAPPLRPPEGDPDDEEA
jgi:hypothetical protein